MWLLRSGTLLLALVALGCTKNDTAPVMTAQATAQPVATAPSSAEGTIVACHAPRLDVIYRARWKCSDGHSQLSAEQAQQIRQRLQRQRQAKPAAAGATFAPPPVGTRLYTSVGGYYDVLAIEDMTISVTNASGAILVLFGGVFIPWIDSDFDREKIEALWPLQVGKSTRVIQVRDKSAWQNDFTVAATERITTPAGTFETYRIENVSQGIGNSPNIFHIKRKYWYAPDVGYFVKYDQEQTSGNPVSDKPWELIRAVKPLASR